MTEVGAAAPPSPQRGLPRTIGILNIVFGGLLLLVGAGACYVMVPFLRENDPLQFDPEISRGVAEDVRREMLRGLETTAQGERDEAARRRLAAAVAELKGVDTDVARQVDFGKVNADLPWFNRYVWINLLSGLVLNALMVLAGVGLVLLRGWGRGLAVVVSALKLVRLVALASLLAFVVVPRLSGVAGQFAATDFGKSFLQHAMDQRGANPVPLPVPTVRFKPDEFVRVLETLGDFYAVLGLGLGAIYPIVVLLVLRRAGVREALAGTGTPPGTGSRPVQ